MTLVVITNSEIPQISNEILKSQIHIQILKTIQPNYSFDFNNQQIINTTLNGMCRKPITKFNKQFKPFTFLKLN